MILPFRVEDARSVREAFRLMQEWNGPSPVNRVENVMGPQKRALERGGFQFRPKEADYLYPVEALVQLAEENNISLVVDKSSILYGQAAIDLTAKLRRRVRGLPDVKEE